MMIRTRNWVLPALLGGSLLACGGTEKSIWDGYGGGHPGATLPEGGEALLEVVHLSSGLTGGEPAVVNWFHAYQYGGAFMGATKFPALGECTPFEHPNSFPPHEIGPTADYVDLGDSITLSGPGLGSGVDVTKVVAGADGLRDNRPSPQNRHAEGAIIYGGPTWQDQNFQDYTIEAGGEYTLNLGSSDKSVSFNFASQTAFPNNNGVEDVVLPATGDMEVTWEASVNPEGQHSKKHSFVFIALAEFPEEGVTTGPTPRFLCQPPEDPDTGSADGSFTIPESVIAQMPDAGIFQVGRYTHWIEALEDNDGNPRKFDLFTIWCSISLYSKE